MHRQNPPRQRRRQSKSMLAHGIYIKEISKDQVKSTPHFQTTSKTTQNKMNGEKEKQLTSVLSRHLTQHHPPLPQRFAINMIDSRSRRGEQLQFWHVLQQGCIDGNLRVNGDGGFAQLGRVGQGAAVGDDGEGVWEGEGGDGDPGVEGDYVVFGRHCVCFFWEGWG